MLVIDMGRIARNSSKMPDHLAQASVTCFGKLSD
jgi:hypothetical protein